MASKFKLQNLLALEALSLKQGVAKECFIHKHENGKLTIECEDESLINYQMSENRLGGLSIRPGKYQFTLKETHVLCKLIAS